MPLQTKELTHAATRFERRRDKRLQVRVCRGEQSLLFTRQQPSFSLGLFEQPYNGGCAALERARLGVAHLDGPVENGAQAPEAEVNGDNAAAPPLVGATLRVGERHNPRRPVYLDESLDVVPGNICYRQVTNPHRCIVGPTSWPSCTR